MAAFLIANKMLPGVEVLTCREEGIRTLDTLLEYTHFPGVRLRPLGHLSIICGCKNRINNWYYKTIL